MFVNMLLFHKIKQNLCQYVFILQTQSIQGSCQWMTMNLKIFHFYLPSRPSPISLLLFVVDGLIDDQKQANLDFLGDVLVAENPDLIYLTTESLFLHLACRLNTPNLFW